MENMKNFKVLLVYPNPPMLGVIPGNLAILSAYLKKADFEVKLFDASIYRTTEKTQDEVRAELSQVKKTDVNKYISYRDGDIFDDFVRRVEEYQPDLIAMTLVDDTIPLGISLLEKIKGYEIPTIVGGVAANFNYEKILKNDAVDIVCIGEGEEALVELCEKMYKDEDYSEVRNLYIKNKDGSITKNPLRPLVDINSLPRLDFSIFEDFRFLRPFHGKVVRMAPVNTDRGCPYSCTYCAAPTIRNLYSNENVGQYFRRKTIDRIIDEIKHVVSTYDINLLWFSAETFLGGREKTLEEFARRYIDEITLPFWCQTRLDTFTEDRTKLLSDMGCQAVSIGLEHGNEQFRKTVLNKHISNEQIIDAFKVLAQYEILVTVNNMIGLPDETRDLVFDTIELNRQIDTIMSGRTSINSFVFSPYTGTPLRKLCIEKGYLKDESQIPSFYQSSTLDMPSMSKAEILGLERTLPFYIRLPKSYYPDIEVAEKQDEEGREMFKRLTHVHNELFNIA